MRDAVPCRAAPGTIQTFVEALRSLLSSQSKQRENSSVVLRSAAFITKKRRQSSRQKGRPISSQDAVNCPRHNADEAALKDACAQLLQGHAVNAHDIKRARHHPSP